MAKTDKIRYLKTIINLTQRAFDETGMLDDQLERLKSELKDLEDGVKLNGKKHKKKNESEQNT